MAAPMAKRLFSIFIPPDPAGASAGSHSGGRPKRIPRKGVRKRGIHSAFGKE